MRLNNRINGFLLLVLGMLISASVTSTVYRPGVTLLGQKESLESELKKDRQDQDIVAGDNCCMYTYPQYEPVVSESSVQDGSPEETGESGDLWEDVRAAFAMPDVDEARLRSHIEEYARHPFLLEQMLRNAQPFCANTDAGPVALAHNGNLVNAARLRRMYQLERSSR